MNAGEKNQHLSKRLLFNYVRKQIPDEQAVEVEEHLADCQACGALARRARCFLYFFDRFSTKGAAGLSHPASDGLHAAKMQISRSFPLFLLAALKEGLQCLSGASRQFAASPRGAALLGFVSRPGFIIAVVFFVAITIRFILFTPEDDSGTSASATPAATPSIVAEQPLTAAWSSEPTINSGIPINDLSNSDSDSPALLIPAVFATADSQQPTLAGFNERGQAGLEALPAKSSRISLWERGVAMAIWLEDLNSRGNEAARNIAMIAVEQTLLTERAAKLELDFATLRQSFSIPDPLLGETPLRRGAQVFNNPGSALWAKGAERLLSH